MFLPVLAFAPVLSPSPVLVAQVTPDTTLGPEQSVVTPDVTVRGAIADRIDGGAIRGPNLFHSFSEFNIDEGDRVYFSNPTTVDHIFSRVTGANPSNIFGTLGVDGSADLFLLNPNGILFGETARLDIEGSFVGTTAGSIQFADGGEFGAIAPTDSSLLTVSVPLGLQYGPAPTGNVVNDGDLRVGAGQALTLFGDTVVHRGRLGTPGGTVNVLGNQVALMGTATVDVSGATGGGDVFIGGDWQGQGPRPTAQTTYVEPDVTINASAIDSGNGGQVIVWAEDATYFAGAIAARGGSTSGDGGFVEVSGRQFLDYRGQTDAQAPNGAIGTLLLDPTNIEVVADPGETRDLGQVDEFGIPDIGGDGTTRLGVDAINTAQSDVVLQALENIDFNAPVDINTEGVGLTAEAGNRISVFSPIVTNEGAINFIVADQEMGLDAANALITVEEDIRSNGGDLLFQSAQDIFVDGAFIGTSKGDGDSGNISINAEGQLTVINGGQVSVGSFGQGDAGNLDVQANEIDLIGESPINGRPSGLFAIVENGVSGAGGDIRIRDVSRLSVSEGAIISTSTFGVGDGGTLKIDADLVEVIGSDGDGNGSGIFAFVSSNATGNAGNLTIEAQQLRTQDGGQISVSTFGDGDAGNLTIQANEIELVGVNPVFGNPSGLFATVEGGATGIGGDVRITGANRLSVTDGANLSALTFGAGNAGNLTIQANEIELVGVSPISENPSGLFATVEGGATGTGGDVRITDANRLLVAGGALLSTSTSGIGDGGTMSIDADLVEVIGDVEGRSSRIFALVDSGAIGNAESLTINAQQLRVENGGLISVSTLGEGDAGNLTIQANEIDLTGVNPISRQSSGVFAIVGSNATGNGGDIRINDANRLSVSEGAILDASTVGAGDGGTLAINADLVEVIGDAGGRGSKIFAVVGPGATGNAESLTINAQQLRVEDGGLISVSTLGEGDAGDLTIQANEIDLRGVNPVSGASSGVFAIVGTNATGTGGNIRINDANRLSVTEGARLSASTSGTGDGGTMSIDADLIEVIGTDENGTASRIIAQVNPSATGNARSLDIDAQQLRVQDGGQIGVSTFGDGDGGDLTIRSSEIELSGVNAFSGSRSGLFADIVGDATGTGGNIRISDANYLSVTGGAILSTSTLGGGDGGTISIDADLIEVIGSDADGNLSKILAEVRPGAIGNANSLIIDAQQLRVQDGAEITVSTLGDGDAGDLTIQADEIELSGINPIEGNSSGLFATVENSATGTGGDILISTNRLSLTDGANVSTSTSGMGDGGNLTIQANEIDLSGNNPFLGNPSALGTSVEFGATGTGGELRISTNRLSLTQGAAISVSTFDTGDSGTLLIDADSIEVIGTDGDGNPSQINAEVNFTATGNANGITIDTQQLRLQDGGQISVSTFGDGDAGDLTIQANKVELSGTSPTGAEQSGLFATVDRLATGLGGNIRINSTQSLSVLGGATIDVSTFGTGDGGTLSIDTDVMNVAGYDEQGSSGTVLALVRLGATGNAGNLTLNAQKLRVQDGGQISVSTFGEGDAGDLTIQANEIELSGVNPITELPSTLFAIVAPTSTGLSNLLLFPFVDSGIRGRGGNININNAQRLRVQDGGQISVSTFGEGDAGNLTIQADEVELVGVNPFTEFASGLFAIVVRDATGTGGNIRIRDANRLSVLEGAILTASTLGTGNTGTIAIDANLVEVIGSNSDGVPSQINTQVNLDATGNARSLTIDTQQLLVQAGGRINVSTLGQGNAGNLTIQANEIDLVGVNPVDGEPSGLVAATGDEATGIGGNIQINNAERLSISEGAGISVSTLGTGDTGTLSIDADLIELFGHTETRVSQIGALVLEGATGNARSIRLRTEQLRLQDGAQISVSTLSEGDAGDLIVQANEIELIGTNGLASSGLFAIVEREATGAGGNITIIDADHLTVAGGATITASTLGIGNAGTLSVDANQVEVLGSYRGLVSSQIVAQVDSGATGNAGALTLDAEQLLVEDGGLVSVQTLGGGDAGDLFINASDIQLSGAGSQILAQTTTDSQAGSIQIQPSVGERDVAIAFQDGATISAETSGNQTGGDIILTAPDAITLSGDGSISARSTGDADAGSLSIITNQLTLTDGIDASVSSIGNANSGTLAIQAQTLALDNQAQLIAETEAGIGGEIDLDVTDRLTLNHGSRISASTQDGQGGEIAIDTATLTVRNASSISANTTGQGDAGNIDITAQESMTVRHPGSSLSTTTIGAGNAGNIGISTPQLTIRSQGQLTASTAGSGRPGNITVRDADRVSLSNQGTISTVLETGATVDSTERTGKITIGTRTLYLGDRAQITSSTAGQGDAGRIRIDVTESITLANNSRITTAVEDGAIGNSQRIRLDTPQLTLNQNSRILATTSGQGNAGRINILNAETIALNNSRISTAIRAGATADEPGSIQIGSRSLFLTDADIVALNAGMGNAGDIVITGDELVMGNRSQISSSTASQGDAGRIGLDATTAIRLRQGSRITTDVRTNAQGNADRVTLNTPILALRNNSLISAATDGNGNPGSIQVNDANRITLNNSRIATTVGPNAEAEAPGNITLHTDQLVLTHQADISASTNGQGSPGQIQIEDADIISLDNSQIATVIGEDGRALRSGSIRLGTRSLSLTHDARIIASTEGEGNAGEVVITGGELVMGDRSQISSSSSVNPNVNPSNYDTAIAPRQRQRFSRSARATDNTLRSDAGNITVRLSNDALITDSNITTEANAFAGGDITLTARDIQLRGDSNITTNVQSGPDGGGDITVRADTILAFDDSDIISSAAGGVGGNITLGTPAFFGENLQLNFLGQTDRNDRVDLSATGQVNGDISTPDVSFIQNSLNTLTEGIINIESLISNSCVVRDDSGSTFLVTGAGGLPERPGDNRPTVYPTGGVQSVPLVPVTPSEEGDRSTQIQQRWQPGDAIIEAQQPYQLPNGEWIISHQCASTQLQSP